MNDEFVCNVWLLSFLWSYVIHYHHDHDDAGHHQQVIISCPFKTLPGLEQYAVKNYAEAFEAFPRALAESSGVKEREVISNLYAAHNAGEKTIGFDIEVRLS